MSSAEVQVLIQLGFTELEASAYAFLLSESPASGYRVAQALGKPFAGVYKALEGLEAKGAVMLSDDDGTRLARAVPPEELIGQLEAGFQRECATARRLLKERTPAERDDRVYRLERADQLLERARRAINGARGLIIGTICPGPLASLSDCLSAAAARGVKVGLKTFAAAEAPGVALFMDLRGLDAVRGAPGEWMSLSIDGRECVEALFAHETGELRFGYWTENPLLAWFQYSGRGEALLVASIEEALANAYGPIRDIRGDPVRMAGGAWTQLEPLKIVHAAFERVIPFYRADTEGKLYLNKRFRGPAGGGSRKRE